MHTIKTWNGRKAHRLAVYIFRWVTSMETLAVACSPFTTMPKMSICSPTFFEEDRKFHTQVLRTKTLMRTGNQYWKQKPVMLQHGVCIAELTDILGTKRLWPTTAAVNNHKSFPLELRKYFLFPQTNSSWQTLPFSANNFLLQQHYLSGNVKMPPVVQFLCFSCFHFFVTKQIQETEQRDWASFERTCNMKLKQEFHANYFRVRSFSSPFGIFKWPDAELHLTHVLCLNVSCSGNWLSLWNEETVYGDA